MANLTPPVIQATHPSQEDSEWRLEARKSEKEKRQRLEEAAKFLSGAISITFTIFLQMNSDAFKSLSNSSWLGATILLWIVALGASLKVVVPLNYTYLEDNPDSIKEAFQKSVNKKYKFLNIGIWAYFGALTMTALVYYNSNIAPKSIKKEESTNQVVQSIIIYTNKKGQDSVVVKRDTIKFPKK